VINLALNQNYWLLLSITNNGFNQYLLKNPVLTLSTGSSLFRQYTPTSAQVNAAAGKTIISNTVDFAYYNVVIGVSAQLFPPVSRRILVDNTNTTSLSIMTASSNSIDSLVFHVMINIDQIREQQVQTVIYLETLYQYQYSNLNSFINKFYTIYHFQSLKNMQKLNIYIQLLLNL
ncbi:hypothetical protein pb186bvf_014192, partial [Paramecium bursaria]